MKDRLRKVYVSDEMARYRNPHFPVEEEHDADVAFRL